MIAYSSICEIGVNQGAGIWLDAIKVGVVFQTANLTVTGAVISDNTAHQGLGRPVWRVRSTSVL